MESDLIEIKVEGKALWVPAIRIGNRTVIVTGRWLKFGKIQDEMFLEGEPVPDPELFIREIQAWKRKADILVFSQKATDIEAKHSYHWEWDNIAAIRIGGYEAWWERIPQESRKNVRKAGKCGVVVKTVELDDEFIRGVMQIYNESPIRQGTRFWHYGKNFETVKQETSTFLESSEFIGAYHGTELIGFIKLVYLGDMAVMMAIVSKNCHRDKRPTNALLAKAVEICSGKKHISHLVYGKYVYGNKEESPLTEFKRRNGFEQVRFPRYYVPLTLKGRIAFKLKLHRGLSGLLPPRLITGFVKVRSKLFETLMGRKTYGGRQGVPREIEGEPAESHQPIPRRPPDNSLAERPGGQENGRPAAGSRQCEQNLVP